MIMKKILFVFSFIIITSLNSFSQVDPIDKERDGAGYVSLLVSGTAVDKQAALLIGGGGGFIVKDIRIGGFFEGLVTNVNFHVLTSENTYKFLMNYGGLWIAYPLWKTKRFHALADLKFCFGKAATQNSINYEEVTKTFIYGAIPYIGAEFYISDNFAISLGVDYRLCLFANKIDDFKVSSINTPNIRLGIKLGIFR